MIVATALTACGIETARVHTQTTSDFYVATVLTACGIETLNHIRKVCERFRVATVLTACGMRRRVRDRRGLK